MTPDSTQRSGILFGLAAYGIWGFAPAYWKVVEALPAVELLAQRVIWSLLIAAVLLAATQTFPVYLAVLRSRRHLFPVSVAAVLLGVNWLVFIYAVSHQQVIATSLGYYLNPLLSVVLGIVVLGERLRRLQWVAVAIASLGVVQYVVTLGELPWIAVALALSFALYGLIRKLAPVEPVVGFAVEMSLLAVPSTILIASLLARGTAQVPTGSFGMDAVVAASGLLTAAPLLCFNAATRRLPLVTVGILQYIAPSIALVLAVALWGEPFTSAHRITFGCVWVALAIFTLESIWVSRRGIELAGALR